MKSHNVGSQRLAVASDSESEHLEDDPGLTREMLAAFQKPPRYTSIDPFVQVDGRWIFNLIVDYISRYLYRPCNTCNCCPSL